MQIELYLSNNRDALGFDQDVPEGISVSIPFFLVKKDFGVEEAITVIISLTAGVPFALLAAWLYDKLKNPRSNHITINRREIQIDKGEIARIIEETLDIKND